MNAASTGLLPYLGVCLAFFGATFASDSQTPHPDPSKPPLKTLSQYSASLADVPAFGFFGPTQCDSRGNLYFHLDTGSYNSGTIMSLERGSWRPHLYKVPPDLDKGIAFFEFSASPLGKVRLLEQRTDLQYDVFSFDSDTNDVDRTHLQIPDHLWISDFVASEVGTFFGWRLLR